MPTVEDRYRAATAYVRRAVATVKPSVFYWVSPVTGIASWYAGHEKTKVVGAELERIEDRWLRATSDTERATVTRDAELLADHVEEALPGAPQDRTRTNLYAGEVQKGTEATSYVGEVVSQTGEVWSWVKDKASTIGEKASSVGSLLLWGGGAVVAWKALDYFTAREKNRVRMASGEIEEELNDNLEDAAEERNARRAGYYVRLPDTNLYYRVIRNNGGRYVLLAPLTDEARDAISEHEVYPVTMPDGTEGEGYSDDLWRYERVSKVPRHVLS